MDLHNIINRIMVRHKDNESKPIAHVQQSVSDTRQPRTPANPTIHMWTYGGPAEVDDPSYDDALLDARVRTLIRLEYNDIRPPDNSFSRLLLTINKTDREVISPNSKPRRQTAFSYASFFKSIQKALAGPTAARIVPTGAALLLMVGLMGANIEQALYGTNNIMYPKTVLSDSAFTYDSGQTSRTLNKLQNDTNHQSTLITSAQNTADGKDNAVELMLVDETRVSRVQTTRRITTRAPANFDRVNYPSRPE